MITQGAMARGVRLLLVCVALGAVAPSPARAAYAEIAAAPVAAGAIARAGDRVVVARMRPRPGIVCTRRAPTIARVRFVSRLYLAHQSLLL